MRKLNVLFRVGLLAAALPLALPGCKKENPAEKWVVKKPPHYSEAGLNTFGCTLNGQPWWANRTNGLPVGDMFVQNPQCVLGGRGGALNIKANYYRDPVNKKGMRSLQFNARQIPDTGIYDFGDGNFLGISYLDDMVFQGGDTCSEIDAGVVTSPTHFARGQLRITYLPDDRRVVAGRFWADLAKPGCDTIRIRDGVFDLTY